MSNSDLSAGNLAIHCIDQGRVMFIAGEFNYFGNAVRGIVFFYQGINQPIERIEGIERVPPILFYHNSEELRLVYKNPYALSDNSDQYATFSRKIGERNTTVETTANLPPKEGFTVVAMPKRFGFE